MKFHKGDGKWAYIRMPEWAWNVLSETLAMDMDSSSFSFEIQHDVSSALEKVEHLNLLAAKDFVLQVGDRFDIVPGSRGVTIKKQKQRRVSKRV